MFAGSRSLGAANPQRQFPGQAFFFFFLPFSFHKYDTLLVLFVLFVFFP